MPERYYKLSQYRLPQKGRWEYVYFSVNEKGGLKIISRDDALNITNSKLEEISEEEKERVLRKPSDG